MPAIRDFTASGNYMRDCRLRAGLSLRNVAHLLGISDLRLSQIERGKRPIDAWRWPDVVSVIPGTTLDGLAEVSRGNHVPVVVGITPARAMLDEALNQALSAQSGKGPTP